VDKKKIIRPLVILLLLALGAGFWWWYSGHSVQDEHHLVLYGNVDIREADLAFNNSEHIASMLVQEGDFVRKGQLLATLDRERFAAQEAASAAMVAVQKAVLARLLAGSRPEEIRQARANVSAAQAMLNDAQTTLKRQKRLFRKYAASKQALDDAQAAADKDRANLKVAEEALKLAIEGPRVEDIDAARAKLRSDQAQQELAREVLKDTSLYAPSDGIIRNRILEPGDMATPQAPVFTLARSNPVWVRTYAPETLLGKLALGMSAEVSTDSYPGKTYRGWVGYISPTAEFTPKNVETPELRTRLVYQLRVYVCNPENELRLGMPATVIISLDQPQPNSGYSTPDCGEQRKQ